MSAKQLSETLDADISTIYRHVHEMIDRDLLVERTRIVRDGSHHSIFESNVNQVQIDVADGELSVRIKRRKSPAERFSRIWTEIRDN